MMYTKSRLNLVHFGSIFEETIIIGPSSSNRVKNRAFANKFRVDAYMKKEVYFVY